MWVLLLVSDWQEVSLFSCQAEFENWTCSDGKSLLSVLGISGWFLEVRQLTYRDCKNCAGRRNTISVANSYMLALVIKGCQPSEKRKYFEFISDFWWVRRHNLASSAYKIDYLGTLSSDLQHTSFLARQWVLVRPSAHLIFCCSLSQSTLFT